jgi:hypothetical protein
MIKDFTLSYYEYFKDRIISPGVILAVLWFYLCIDGWSVNTLNAILAGLLIIILEDYYLLTKEED